MGFHGHGMHDMAHTAKIWTSAKVNYFSPATPPLEGYGARALKKIDKGELLLRVPVEACLVPLELEDAPPFVDEQQKLMLRLLQEVLVNKKLSAWKAYLDTLPREFPTMPLWFNEAELKLLRGTRADAFLCSRHIADQDDLKAISEWCVNRRDIFPHGAAPGTTELRWAASVVASRAFDSAQVGVLLAPFADGMNHTGNRSHTRMVDSGEFLSFWSEREIHQGEEILNCYGEKGNLQWLLNGGFVERENPFDEVFVLEADVIAAVTSYRRQQGIVSDISVCDAAEDEDVLRLTVQDPFPHDLEELLSRTWARQCRAEGTSTAQICDKDLLFPNGLLLCLVDLLDQRFPTTLAQDEEQLSELDALTAHAAGESAAMEAPLQKKMKGCSVHPANVRNALILRVGQRHIITKLRQLAEGKPCIA